MDTSGFTITLLALILILCLVYLLLRKNYSHWDKLNIPCFPDPMTGFGHFWPIISLKESLATGVQKIYNATSASMIGFYLVQKPCILVRDPELVKSVLVTNFKSFHDNFVTVSKKQDPARSMSPFLTRGYDQWKLARTREVNHLSGQKLRYLFLIVQEISCKFSAYIERKIEESKDGVFECELRSLFVKFTGEIVANTALSMEGQSFVDNPHKFAFASRASTIFEPTLTNGIKQSLLLYMPIIARLLGIQQISQDTVAYFRENLKAAIKERRQSNIKQNDYLQFCMDGNAEDEIENIVGEIIIYWVDVYETSSASAATLFYFLANNPKVQEKLRNQINDILKETGGAVTYESLKSMNYFDQVLKESLRLIPVLSTFLKVCTEEITLEGSDGLKCNFRPGDTVLISATGLHMDPQYYSEPEIFDPERFSPENVASRHKFLYLGFGEGPRICLGMRFATIMLKVATTLISKFSIEKSSKTAEPLEFEPASYITMVKGGLWAQFRKLN